MINVRKKGQVFEREVVTTFKERGWKNAATSRYESKKRDDEKVDLVNTSPFNIQCKAVQNLGSRHGVLAEMPDDGNINLLFHKIDRKGTVVSMTEKDFWRLLNYKDRVDSFLLEGRKESK